MSRRKFLKDITAASVVIPLAPHSVMDADSKNIKHIDEKAGYDFTQQQLENATRELRAKLLADHLRPVYHFVAPEGHTHPFDPNGAIYWKGQYHLGYIFQHNDTQGKRIHWWGHVISNDLFHWHIVPPMLRVDENDPESGIFSGGAFISKEGTPHIVYHGTESGNCIAKATDDGLLHWEKFEENPVLPLKQKKSLTEYNEDNSGNAWDPHIWLEGDTYYQISGGNPPGLFKSADLYHWQYVGQFIDQSKVKHHVFEDWSCPDIFKLGEKYVTIAISHNLGTQYYIGDFVNEEFIPEKHGRMNWHGGTFFAPETLVDDKGRRILWGWVLETRKYDDAHGWSGVMSLPRVLSLNTGGEMQVVPPEEIKSIRYNGQTAPDVILTDKQEQRIVGFSGNAVELHATFQPQGNGRFGIKVLCADDGREETIIKYDWSTQEIVIDFQNSALPGNVRFPSYCMMGYLDKSVPEFVSEQRVPFPLAKGEKLQLEIFIDKSIIEVFANNRICVTQRVYPTSGSSTGIKLFSEGATVEVSGLSCWQMAKTNFC